jgi:ubiquinone/menaquinone biosynthesis C-methylase UbiE
MRCRRLFLLVLPLLALTVCAVAPAGDLKADLIAKVPMYKTSIGAFAPLYPAFAKQMIQDYGITKGICVDVGSGPASFAMEMAKASQMTVYALDIDSNAVRLASILVDEAGLTGRVLPLEGDAQNLPFRDEFADLVFSRGSIPFWPDREAGVRECYRILKPGGVAYIGGGFTHVLPPEVRDPIAQSRAQHMKDHPDSDFRTPSDLDQVALRAGVPASQFRFTQEPIAGWWLEIRKPADHAAWYRQWNAKLAPWHAQMAREFVDRYHVRRGRCLEVGWGAGPLSLQLARITNLDLYVVGHDDDAARVTERLALEGGVADRVHVVTCSEACLLFRDSSFDYVVGHAGGAVWKRVPPVYREIGRVLRPGGVALVGTGVPMQCTPESEKQFRQLAKGMREAPDAPPAGFERCPERPEVEQWLREAGVQGSMLSKDGAHHAWVEIRK